MPRPRPVVFGLYAWSPDYGYSYLHPANRRSFEWLHPVGKVFEKVSDLDEDSEWITLRYDEQQFLVRGELFKEIYNKPLSASATSWRKSARPPVAPRTADCIRYFLERKPGPRHLPDGRAQAQSGAGVRGQRAAQSGIAFVFASATKQSHLLSRAALGRLLRCARKDKRY